MKDSNPSLVISVVGLGYVGLPVASSFAKKYPVVGFDIASSRIKELSTVFHKLGIDTYKPFTQDFIMGDYEKH